MPHACVIHLKCFGKWCRHQDSNSGPDDYKSTALPTELYRQRPRFYINNFNVGSC